MNNQSPQNVTSIKIDPWSVIKIILIFLLVGFLYLIRDIIVIFLASVILALVIAPIVDWLERKKVSRVLSTLFIYLFLISLFVALIVFLIPIISQQTKQLVSQLPILIKNFLKLVIPYFGAENISNLVNKFLGNWFSQGSMLAGQGLFSLFRSVIGTFVAFITFLVIAFYITVERRAISDFLKMITPSRYHQYLFTLINSSQKKIGAWGRGVIILCFFVGLLSYIGLRILGVNYALLLALIAGLTEMIPWFGPAIGAIPAVLLAFIQSPIKGLLVIILYVLIQQIENNVLVPQVMKRTSGLRPLIVIIVVLIGGKLAGVVGLLLAVPVTTIIVMIVGDYLKVKKQAKENIKSAV